MILESFPTQAEFAERLKTASVIPVGVRILADTETPVSVLARFADACPNMFLFESADGGERWGRYSFMGTSARAVVTVFQQDVIVREGIRERRIPHQGNPMAVLRTLLAPYQLAEIPGIPRFCGGLVGYIAYEMAHFFETRVPSHLPADRPLAEMMIPDNLLVFDNVKHTLSVMALAFRDDAAPEALYADAKARVAALLRDLERHAPDFADANRAPIVLPEAVNPPEHYMEMVAKVKEHILEGDIIQCVVSQSFVGPAPDDLVSLYRAQRFVNPSPYLFFFKCHGCTLIGSSPETLIRLDNRTATLRPIAGTRPRGKTEQEDRKLADSLLQDEKERAEHLMLVDLARNELGRVSLPGTVQVTDLMFVERYSHVMHLVSNVVGELEPARDAFDLFQASFPAGTLSGAPKIRAMEIIAELETEPRGAYGGACGYFSFDGNMDFAICIRTAIVEHKRLTIRAGAGIVADSDPASEHLETVNKAKGMARALELLKQVQEAAAPAR
ncbi:MAG: anthranilate synthase component I family protein [Kiritimatiellae bacterium]|jgi:anthranilate synthase component 1|nr:anthranilate synthase component I family protein [Kiritimatiellia bacterium]